MIKSKKLLNLSGSKHTAILFVLLIVFSCAVAQTDSLQVVRTKWVKTKVAPGVMLKHYWFNHSLFGSNQNINILEIKMNHRNKLDVEAEPQTLKTTSTFGEEHDALAALNGTFFNMKNGGSEDYIRLHGKTLNETHLPKSDKRALHQKAAIVIKNGRLFISAWNGSTSWEDSLPGEDIMVTGPLLLKSHDRMKLDSAGFNTARHPRSAVAVRGNKVLLVTVDGRNEKAGGMSLYELASFLKWMKASDAINLDGGGSTTLWIKGFPDSGVINHPSDNKAMMKSAAYKPGTDLDNLAADDKKWDHGGQRPVANVIVVNEKK